VDWLSPAGSNGSDGCPAHSPQLPLEMDGRAAVLVGFFYLWFIVLFLGSVSDVGRLVGLSLLHSCHSKWTTALLSL
jgi:hypothetical protein